MTEKEKRSLLAKADKQAQKRAREDAREQELRAKAEAASSEKAKRRLLHRAERHQIKANAAKVRGRQLTERSEGKINDAEWKRIGRSRRNHRLYDAISAVTRRFLPKNPLRDEGMHFWGPDMSEATSPNKLPQPAQYTNKGRIFLGGTKAMNLFENAAGKQFLCKEAVTCVGTYKPMGALVTEAASRLQEQISPDTAIRAFTYKKDGRVLGSLQERLDVKPDGFDLFKWQADTSKPIPAHLPNQILREHVTDWLLCNFDTKGENFLEDSQGRLRGIDKEQALSFLGHKDAQHMSYKFSPNPNKTLYNSVFELYAQGKMDLDLGQVDQYIQKIERISDGDYVDMFYEVVKTKCKGDPARMEKMNAQILARKTGLRAEYERFFGELAKERGATELLDENGNFSFAKAAEKAAEAGGRTAEGPEKTSLDRSRFEKPLTMEESLQAQRLQTQLNRTVRSLSQRMEAEGVSPEQREALGEVRDTAQTIKDYNAKRLAGRITPDESIAFHRLLDPAHAKESGARPEVVKFTQELHRATAPETEKQAPGLDGPKPAAMQQQRQHQHQKQAPARAMAPR